jgi:hypothetical protein
MTALLGCLDPLARPLLKTRVSIDQSNELS